MWLGSGGSNLPVPKDSAQKRPVFADLRIAYHKELCSSILGHRPDTTVFSVADRGSKASIGLAADMAERMRKGSSAEFCKDIPDGQTAGDRFTRLTLEFLEAAFTRLEHIRPGEWSFSIGQRPGIAGFYQYEHLADLQEVLRTHKDLKAALGGDYLITPDIVVARRPLTDSEINTRANLLSPDDSTATLSPLRGANYAGGRPILHASVSCKWTLRSDRAQNARTEGLNLIRNRKGNAPHIVFVTLEPLPSRLASIALGTGDVDCSYHAALHELIQAVDSSEWDDAAEMLHVLVDGRRLRDISDLPLDLAT